MDVAWFNHHASCSNRQVNYLRPAWCAAWVGHQWRSCDYPGGKQGDHVVDEEGAGVRWRLGCWERGWWRRSEKGMGMRTGTESRAMAGAGTVAGAARWNPALGSGRRDHTRLLAPFPPLPRVEGRTHLDTLQGCCTDTQEGGRVDTTALLRPIAKETDETREGLPLCTSLRREKWNGEREKMKKRGGRERKGDREW